MQNKLEIYGVPMDLGVDLRGVDMGPSALRIAGIRRSLQGMGFEVGDYDELDIASRITLKPDSSNAKYLEEINRICEALYNKAREFKQKNAIPIFLGGDHSIAMGTVAGVSSHYQDQNEKIGLIWFDAHADMNTPESSPSGNVHGMPLAALMSLGGSKPFCKIAGKANISPENIFIIGARDLDGKERDLVAKSGATVFSMKEIDSLGMAECAKRAIQGASKGTAGFHLSFDIDGLDPKVAPGVGTPVRGGVNFREAHLLMELIADSEKLLGVDIVELNPVKDIRNESAEVVVHLMESAFGRSIIKN